MNDIKVVISGREGTGKSTVAHIIEKAISKTGAEVQCIDDNGLGIVDEPNGLIGATAEKRMSSLINRGLRVTIKTVNVHA